MLTTLNIVDNTGANFARVIKILNKKTTLAIGVLVLVSVTKNISHSKIRKGDVIKAILINASHSSIITKIISKKSIILVKLAPKGKEYLPLGTRIKGPVSSNLRNKNGMNRIISLSKRTL